MKESIQSRSDLAREIQEQQSTFSYGWEKAYREYAENANDAARAGADAFRKATKGMEDSIVGFAKTGKFEWKSFVADMAETILRSNVQKLIANLFGGGGMGGGSGSSSGYYNSGNQQRFGGYFAQGGMIPAGKFGVVGESGAEFVSGPAQVTPMPTQSVTYNINAVDALSFRQLVARDPGFIHAVAAQGARTIPGGRR
jgi:lambda family phage tail tape measure protein